MTLDQLRYFIHVAGTGSFSQSAGALGISQPSLSRHIQQLEGALGAALFDRYHRPMVLTDAGQFFLEHCQKHVHALDEAITLTRHFHHAPASGQFSIGFVASILYGLLPEFVSALKQRCPALDVRLIELSANEQIDALKAGEIDAGFGRFLCADSFIRQIFLRHERFVVALPISHPLAQRAPDVGISFKELMDETLILYHRTPLPSLDGHGSDQLLHLFAQRNLHPTRTAQARDLQIALGLVSAGEGVTLVPDSLRRVRPEQIHYHRLHHENATSPIYLNLLTSPTHPHARDLLDVTYALYEQKGITYTRTQLADDTL